MSTNLFYFLWGLFAVIFIVILAFAGKVTKNGLVGALIDNRNRYSLNRFQLLMWTVLIFSAFLAFFFAGGLDIPIICANLLGLLGISVASATTAGAVKSSKDLQFAAADAQRKKLNAYADSLQGKGSSHDQIAAVRAAAVPPVPNVPPAKKPRLIQMILEEEGQNADQEVNVTKFQNLILTLVAGVAFVAMVVDQKTLDLVLPGQFLWLIGISHSGYVAAKVPNRV
jgi:hypothetical protein